MKCQDLFSGENKISIINASSAELDQKVVKVNSELQNIGSSIRTPYLQ